MDGTNMNNNLVLNQESINNYPLVSIITPSYNQGTFIRETINSVLSQDYPYIEYIIIDGGSTDNTLEILNEYRNKLYYVSEPDEGQSDAVNKGLKKANGEIIGWINSDDLYYPGVISKIVDIFRNYPTIDVVYGEGYHISKSGTEISRYPTELFDYQKFAERCFICQPTVFFRRECLESTGFLNKELQLCMDYDLWIRMGKKHNFFYFPEKIAKSRIYRENKTCSRTGEVFKEILKMIHSHYGYYPISWIYGHEKFFRKNKSSWRLIIISLIKFMLMNYPIRKETVRYLIFLCVPRFVNNEIQLEIMNLYRLFLSNEKFLEC